MDKNRLIILIIAIVLGVSLLTLVGLRFLLGGDEDVWLCVGNQWVRHGNPIAQMPSGGCGTSTQTNITDGWATYSSAKYGFEIKHPKDWKTETYGPFQASSAKLYQVLFTDSSADVQKNPSRQVYWTIDIWKPTASDSKIAQDSGFLNFDVKDLGANIQSAIQSSQPSAITNGMATYRLFVIKGTKYTYSLKSDLCRDELASGCAGILQSFKLLEQ